MRHISIRDLLTKSLIEISKDVVTEPPFRDGVRLDINYGPH